MPFIAMILFAGFGLLGRWMLLHPESIVPKGMFMGRNTFFARLFRAEVLVIGTCAVFGGTCAALSAAFSLVAAHSWLISWTLKLVAVAAGVVAAIHVHKELKARPSYESTNPYGWWP
ncbi:MAG: hypothetical protein ACLPXM_05215 [Terriglobales bacterium]